MNLFLKAIWNREIDSKTKKTVGKFLTENKIDLQKLDFIGLNLKLKEAGYKPVRITYEEMFNVISFVKYDLTDFNLMFFLYSSSTLNDNITKEDIVKLMPIVKEMWLKTDGDTDFQKIMDGMVLYMKDEKKTADEILRMNVYEIIDTSISHCF